MSRRIPNSRLKAVAVVTLQLTLLTASTIFAAQTVQAQEETVAESARRGKRTYQIYCQSCHGSKGRGDGPVAAELKHAPADLSLLARRAGGEFPTSEVRRKIDGRDLVPSHGPSDMPVWGLTFELRGDADPLEIEQRINELVELLRSLQRPSDSEEG